MIAHLLLLTLAAAAYSQPQGGSGLCPPRGRVLVAHEWDCTKYYQCHNGVLRGEASCSRRLEFSAERQACVRASIARCSLPGVPPTIAESFEDKSDSSRETIDNDNSYESNNNGDLSAEDGRSECPTNGDELLLANEADCSKFFQCANGEKVEFDCPARLLFDAERQICDYPQNVKCGKGNDAKPEANEASYTDNNNDDSDRYSSTTGSDRYSSTTGSDRYSSTTGSDRYSSTTGSDRYSSTTNSPVNDGECPTNGDELLLPHESECGSFYQCDHGSKVERRCPAGLSFNAQTQACDWPENVPCGNPCAAACHVAPWPAAECGQYWTCEGDRPVQVTCSFGLQFNAKTGTCDYARNVRCSDNERRL